MSPDASSEAVTELDVEILTTERALIGGVILGRGEIIPDLQPEEFISDRHAQIWREILDLAEGVTAAELGASLAASGRLDGIGGPAYLAQCVEDGWCVIASLIGRYAALVRAAWRSRLLRAIGSDLARQGFDEQEIARRLAEVPGPFTTLGPWDPAATWADYQASRAMAPAVQTGLASLDGRLGGLLPGELTVIGGRTSHGKALALDTELPTPTGWTTIGSVRTGDILFGANGLPVEVIYVSPIMVNRPCYKLVFSDGSVLVADAEHRWVTTTRAERRAGCPGRIRTTEEIAKSLRHLEYRNHAIRTCDPVYGDEAKLPVDPYVLGVWLGDGTSSAGSITSTDADIVRAIEATGQRVSRRRDPSTYGLLGLGIKLRRLGVLNNKHIPMNYLRASESQRRALLAGLLDTDGTVLTEGAVGFEVTRSGLAVTALELIRSLGYRATMSARRVRGRTEASSTCFRIRFATSDKVFRLRRKAMLLERRRAAHYVKHRTDGRTIVDVIAVPSVPVRCVQVASADGLYLAGRSWIPTHNSSFAIHISLAMAAGGVPVLFVSLEETVALMTLRALSARSGIPYWRLATGTALNEEEAHEVDVAATWLGGVPWNVIALDTFRALDEDTVCGVVAAATSPVVVVDHLQKVITRDDSRAYGIERVLNRLHAQALRDQRVVIVCAQLNRDSEHERRPPRLSDLRDSGAVEILARKILLVYWPFRHDPARDRHDYIIYVAKQSTGGTGEVALRFRAETGEFWDPGNGDRTH